MSTSDKMQLDVWKGDWGLPSIDTECLQVMAYARFNGIPLQVKATNNPFKTSNGRLPVLRTKHTCLDKVSEIILYLKKTNFENSENGSKEYAEFIAYDTMLKDKLYPAMQFIWWLDQANLNELIRPWYCKAVPFPFNYYYPSKFENQAKAVIETLYPMEDNMTVIGNKVYSEAQKCLTSLSTRLGNSKYFLGQSHTMLDAVVYSYLAPLLKTPLVNPSLQNHLKACTNLVNFVTHISQKYFRDEYIQYEKIKSENNINKMRKDSYLEFPNKRRDQVLAGIFAFVAMVGYALLTGKLEVPIKDKKMINEDAE
ncbi:PREDICTED: metaxin-1, partial [Polistes dominula]|uniref:Metaxin-1 n=1 Tax=Polistes dominula TaxID=743375 RepID=A0ABM1I498_POLDO